MALGARGGGLKGLRTPVLLAHAERIREIADSHGATNLDVFGSVARNQAGPNSDVDLLVDLPPHTGLLDRIALKQALEDALHFRLWGTNFRGVIEGSWRILGYCW